MNALNTERRNGGHIQSRRPAYDQDYYDGLATRLVSLVDEAVGENKGGQGIKVADVGCGRGEVLELLCHRGYDALGVDIDPSNIMIKNSSIQVVQGDLLRLSEVPDIDGVKVIVLSHVLEHVHSPLTALNECRKTGARWIVIAVPNLGRWSRAKTTRLINNGHQVGWDRNHLMTFLECHAGMKVEKWVADTVTLRLRRFGFFKSRVYRYIERSFLPKLLPQLSTSLIVLCKVVK